MLNMANFQKLKYNPLKIARSAGDKKKTYVIAGINVPVRDKGWIIFQLITIPLAEIIFKPDPI